MADVTENDIKTGLIRRRAQTLLSGYLGWLAPSEIANLERIVADPSEADRHYLGLFDRLLERFGED